jgi:TonB-dependent receptor
VGSRSATVDNFAPGSTYEHSELLPIASSTAIVESTPAFFKFSKNFKLGGGGEMKLFQGSAKLELHGSYSRANISYPGWIRAQAETPGGIGFEIDRRGQDDWYPIFRQTAGPSIYDPASYVMSSYQKQSYRAPNELYSLRADFTKTFATSVPTKIKVGAKYTDGLRKPRTHVGYYTWVGADGLPNSDDDALTPYVGLHYNQGDGRYGPFPFMTNPEELPAEYWTQTAANVYNGYANSLNSRSNFQERIGAAYVQGSMKLGPVRVLGGVRVEDTETKGTAWVRNTTASWGGNNSGGSSRDPAVIAANLERAQRSFVRRNTSTGQYRDVFPGVHFVYEPLPDVLVRTSYNASISRPPVPNLIPTVSENADNQTVTMGNPGLRPYHSDNFELSVEKYFEPVGQFSAGVFLKEISDYFRTFSTTVGPEGLDGNGQYAGYTLRQTRNIGDARVRGFELSYQQQFSFLPGVWRGLGTFANYTYLQAEGDFGSLETTDQLGNLAPRSGNGGINFRWRGLDVRFLANWTAQKYKTTVAGIDVYNEERLMLDVKLQYRFNRRYDMFLDITNITDESPRTDTSLNGLHFFKTNQGVGFVAGVRGRF